MTEAQVKAFDDSVVETVRRSVEDPERVQDGAIGRNIAHSLIYFAARVADGIVPWGVAPTLRDNQLRSFFISEPFAMSAFSAMAARNAAFGWKLEGPNRSKNKAHDLLHRANWGRGWLSFITEFSLELYLGDKGAFVELIRRQDSPNGEIIGFRVLPSAYCFATGDPEIPVLFYNAVKGTWHELKWWQVYHALEMPLPTGTYQGLQVSAATRVFRAAQVWRNILQFEEEKTAGRHTRSITIIGGVGMEAVEDALQTAQNISNQRLQERFAMPAIATTVDPEAKIDAKTIDFMGPPDQFDRSEWFKEYLTLLALGLLTDYQDLAPLPGGNLGSGAQSVVLDKKASQKGAGLFRKIIEHMMNFTILPDSVEFQYDEEDLDEEKEVAEIKKTRAEARGLMVQTGELDAAGARQQALDDGDISEELFLAMNERDLTEESIRDDERKKLEQEIGVGTGIPGQPVATPNIVGVSGFGTGGAQGAAQQAAGNTPTGDQEQTTIQKKSRKDAGDMEREQKARDIARYLSIGVGTKEQALGAYLQTRIHRAFTTAADDIAALGYVDTAERIGLSNLIGRALHTFSELIDEEAGEVAARRLADCDLETLLNIGSKQVDEERLAAETDATAEIEKPFHEMFANIRRRLRADN